LTTPVAASLDAEPTVADWRVPHGTDRMSSVTVMSRYGRIVFVVSRWPPHRRTPAYQITYYTYKITGLGGQTRITLRSE